MVGILGVSSTPRATIMLRKFHPSNSNSNNSNTSTGPTLQASKLDTRTDLQKLSSRWCSSKARITTNHSSSNTVFIITLRKQATLNRSTKTITDRGQAQSGHRKCTTPHKTVPCNRSKSQRWTTLTSWMLVREGPAIRTTTRFWTLFFRSRDQRHLSWHTILKDKHNHLLITNSKRHTVRHELIRNINISL